MKSPLPRNSLVALVLGVSAWSSQAAATLLVQMRDVDDARTMQIQSALASRAPAWRAGAPLTGRWVRVTAPSHLSPAAAEAWARQLRADPRIQAVAVDAREQRQAVTPSDERFDSQWWLKQANGSGNAGVAGFASAWARSTGAPASGSGAVVAILDSGITSHPELNARVLPGWDFVSDPVYSKDGDGRDNDPSDPGDAVTATDRAGNPDAFSGCPEAPQSSWHGTTIAGQVAAVTDNREGVAAANWAGRALPVRVAGKCGAAVSDIVDGLRWAAGLSVTGVPANPTPARVIVLSYGSSASCNASSSNPSTAATAQLYLDAIAEVRAAGAMVIVAAGNQRGEVGRPGNCEGAFTVTSTNRQGFKAAYAGFGKTVALATPGGDGSTGTSCDPWVADSGIVSTGNLGVVDVGAAGYVAASGTSFAGPAVAATATLMLAVNPSLSVAQLEDGLRRSARPHAQVPIFGVCSSDNTGPCQCTTSTCGAGLLDAAEALAFAATPASYTAPTRSAVTLDNDGIRNCAVLLGKPLPEPNPDPEPEPEPQPGGSSSGGGGAMPIGWLLALLFASLMARRKAG